MSFRENTQLRRKSIHHFPLLLLLVENSVTIKQSEAIRMAITLFIYLMPIQGNSLALIGLVQSTQQK